MDIKSVACELQKLQCHVHHKHPEVFVRGDKLEFKCCCEEFRSRLVDETKPLIESAAKAEIEKVIRKAFG